MKRLYHSTFSLALISAVAGCVDKGGTSDTDGTGSTGGSTGQPTTTTGTPEDCSMLMISGIDESACKPLASDYQPRDANSANDTWPACVSDMGPYALINGTPGAQARIEAYEKIADYLWRKKDPTPDDFTNARDQYVIPEGLESRVSRREDLHADPIPMSAWDPQVDIDKQCTVGTNAMDYPDRCVGPMKIQPIIDAAFAAGQKGEGDVNVHAARLHGALVWFVWLSIYKEADTCTTVAAEDCDASWAYYTGGETIDKGLGLSGEVRALSVSTHERVHDGIMAVRCWRDLNQDGMGGYPLWDMIPQDQKDLFNQGWEQLDQALHRAVALVVRGHMEAFYDAACAGAYKDAEWAFLEVAGPVLQREAELRDPTNAKILADLWANKAPTAADVADAVVALDAIFPCP